MGKWVWSAGELDVDKALRRQERCMLVAGVCLIGGAVLVLGWLFYAACLRWPACGNWAMPLGWALEFCGVSVAVARCVTGR